jgi:hypothetical protein
LKPSEYYSLIQRLRQADVMVEKEDGWLCPLAGRYSTKIPTLTGGA